MLSCASEFQWLKPINLENSAEIISTDSKWCRSGRLISNNVLLLASEGIFIKFSPILTFLTWPEGRTRWWRRRWRESKTTMCSARLEIARKEEKESCCDVSTGSVWCESINEWMSDVDANCLKVCTTNAMKVCEANISIYLSFRCS